MNKENIENNEAVSVNIADCADNLRDAIMWIAPFACILAVSCKEDTVEVAAVNSEQYGDNKFAMPFKVVLSKREDGKLDLHLLAYSYMFSSDGWETPLHRIEIGNPLSPKDLELKSLVSIMANALNSDEYNACLNELMNNALGTLETRIMIVNPKTCKVTYGQDLC